MGEVPAPSPCSLPAGARLPCPSEPQLFPGRLHAAVPLGPATSSSGRLGKSLAARNLPVTAPSCGSLCPRLCKSILTEP